MKALAGAVAAGLSFFSLARPALAHCPLCVAATGSALAVTRVAGIDDLISGLFIGAFLLATALWTDRLITKRHGRPYFRFQQLLVAAAIVGSSAAMFLLPGLASIETFLGFDRLLVGLLLGLPVTLLAFQINSRLKNAAGHVFLPFQVAIVTILVLGGFAAALFVAEVG